MSDKAPICEQCNALKDKTLARFRVYLQNCMVLLCHKHTTQQLKAGHIIRKTR
jgi:hypothetical protein